MKLQQFLISKAQMNTHSVGSILGTSSKISPIQQTCFHFIKVIMLNSWLSSLLISLPLATCLGF